MLAPRIVTDEVSGLLQLRKLNQDSLLLARLAQYLRWSVNRFCGVFKYVEVKSFVVGRVTFPTAEDGPDRLRRHTAVEGLTDLQRPEDSQRGDDRGVGEKVGRSFYRVRQ